ncbi:MAG: hypothetical protein ISS45_02175 [Candidatus Omnitrophica bacterium]|nr:hypothetical protein [Candidatus Omnitrophota bacterium]
MQISWEPEVKKKFDIFISKMPIFHRRIAEKLVTERVMINVKSRNAATINEEDLLNAIFSEVPHPFYTMMVRLLDELGFDYKKYGLPRVSR